MTLKSILTRLAVLSIMLPSPAKLLLGQTTVEVFPSSQSVAVGASVAVQIKINNVTNLHGSSVTVAFDNTILEYKNATSGGFLETNSSGYSVFFAKYPQPPSAPSTVQVDLAILGPATVSGSGTLISISFKALQTGVSAVTITAFDLRDGDNHPISATASSGQVMVGIRVNAKVFLQSPYNDITGLMKTDLNSGGWLPTSQPYNVLPWNYTGAEGVASGFFSTHTDIVDWVLVELRSGTGSSTKVGMCAAFLKSNGSIVDMDGSSTIGFPSITVGNYYIVVRHRNHLAIMSANLLDFSSGIVSYDFTTAMTQAYGTDALKELVAGLGPYGMWVGDVTANGMIKYNGAGNDRLPILMKLGYVQSATLNGYWIEDLNMNGQVKYNGANNDRLIILQNLNYIQSSTRSTQVPN
jgi:hypothetical protein